MIRSAPWCNLSIFEENKSVRVNKDLYKFIMRLR